MGGGANGSNNEAQEVRVGIELGTRLTSPLVLGVLYEFGIEAGGRRKLTVAFYRDDAAGLVGTVRKIQ